MFRLTSSSLYDQSTFYDRFYKDLRGLGLVSLLSSPLSFSGSARRIWRITSVENPIVKIALLLIAIILIAGAWVFVLFWYFLCTCYLVHSSSYSDYSLVAGIRINATHCDIVKY